MKQHIVIILFFIMFINLVGCELNNKKVNTIDQQKFNLNGGKYYVLYTSFEKSQSSLFTYSKTKKLNKIDIKDIALENISYYKNKILLNSRYSGNYYEISNSETVVKSSIPSKSQVTNSFYTKDGIILITNGGLSNRKGKKIYKSGLYGTHQNLSEKKYEKGFFTGGRFFNNHYYILTFDPSVEKEQLLKIDLEGNIKKIVNLGTKPTHSFRSMEVLGDYLYLFSNDGEILKINKDGTVKNKIKSSIISEVAEVLKKDNKLYVLYYSGDMLLYSKNGIDSIIKLKNLKNDNLIFLKSKFVNNSINILYVYDRQFYNDSFKYDGVIYSYNLKNGNITNSLLLPKINGMRLHDFEAIHKE